MLSHESAFFAMVVLIVKESFGVQARVPEALGEGRGYARPGALEGPLTVGAAVGCTNRPRIRLW